MWSGSSFSTAPAKPAASLPVVMFTNLTMLPFELVTVSCAKPYTSQKTEVSGKTTRWAFLGNMHISPAVIKQKGKDVLSMHSMSASPFIMI